MGVHSGPAYLIFDRDWVGESSGKQKKRTLVRRKSQDEDNTQDKKKKKSSCGNLTLQSFEEEKDH